MYSYKQVFSPRKGNLLQRVLKFWIIPRFPHLEVAVYILLGVGLFRLLLMKTIGRLGAWSRYQTNYHIGRLTMNNLLTFVTNQTMFNEIVHIVAFLPSFFFLTALWWAGMPVFVTTNLFVIVIAAINLYCIMLQRYNRARLVVLIEDKLNTGHLPDSSYKNWLALDFTDRT
ncbi:hypothetical protein COY48_01705 [Candidatus Collierbacteria bacterium CG_4_10_14_0_8_um_filter_43_86]|uniref:Glycosyl-4,4'-diaponeurosporenoate acyltransferase n=2 Tax=Candidatus Collieribacteriota TaxID=1752725 RepID=A0A2H0DTS7_9BACT|nr:MAG: hypothetical protein COW83_03500 [Candidatus Collierbacteria bacterium CG22_combo_CG10-13_8_21_14_all_43_12]PIZ24670.1 MAG: hypothetical protein COY48_01705 [Candidatus Collierbacteria bacterium CG_4_10_14_0_8_um_filter_43_86]PJB47485.1 MAG: hypothetical protein CO104_03515 [Candidatus Collierbacteria bacterium CG_4_9_14_3_um_filter_43_16]